MTDGSSRAAGSTRGVETRCPVYSTNTPIHDIDSSARPTGAHGGARASRQRIRSRAIAAYESLAQCHLSDFRRDDDA